MSELGTVERAYADGYAAAQHEIERLRNEIWHEKALSGAMREAVVRLASNRAAVIEECATLVEQSWLAQGRDYKLRNELAAAIRALKKP